MIKSACLRRGIAAGAVAGLVFAGSFQLSSFSASASTTLQGFELQQTGSDTLQVVLHTGKKGRNNLPARYMITKEGQNISLILAETDLSPDQLKKGAPVVVDPRNRFIGQAIPIENHQVKISLPNLNAKNYRLAVIEKPAQAAEQENNLSPRTESLPSDNFESIASQFQNKTSQSAATPGRKHWRLISSTPATTVKYPSVGEEAPEFQPFPAHTQVPVKTQSLNRLSQGIRFSPASVISSYEHIPLSLGKLQPGYENPQTENSVSERIGSEKAMPEKIAPEKIAMDELLAAAGSAVPASPKYAIPPTIETPVNQQIPSTGGQNFLAVADHQAQETDQAKQLIAEGAAIIQVLFGEMREIIEVLPVWFWTCIGLALISLSLLAAAGALVLFKLVLSPLMPQWAPAVPGLGFLWKNAKAKQAGHTEKSSEISANPSNEELLIALKQLLQASAGEPNTSRSQQEGKEEWKNHASQTDPEEAAYSSFIEAQPLDRPFREGTGNDMKTAVQNAVLLKFPVQKRHHASRSDSHKRGRTSYPGRPSGFTAYQPQEPKFTPSLQEIKRF